MPKKIDLAGQRFGRLLVIEEHPERGPQGQTKWKCVCDCGNNHVVLYGNLSSGNTSSCGCLQKDATRAARKLSLQGQRFDRLLVIEEASSPDSKTRWYCRCDCGTERVVRGETLVNGNSRSCGCRQRDFAAAHALDYSGRRFGRLQAVERVDGHKRSWHCVCDCGREVVVSGTHLASGHTQSCGCLKRELVTQRHAAVRELRGPDFQIEETPRHRRLRRMREKRDGLAPNRKGVWQRDSGGAETALCHLCEYVVREADPWVMEHLVPLWREAGTDSYKNVAVVCASCAKAKTAGENTERAQEIQELRRLADLDAELGETG